MTYLGTGRDIADATLDLVDEIHDVENGRFMHATIMHRFQTRPEAMAQMLMTMAFWVGAASIAVLDDTTGMIAVERCRKQLEAGKLNESEFMRVARGES